MKKSLDSFLRSLSFQYLVVLLVVMDLLVFYVDYITGPRVPCTLLYLALIYLSLKYAGSKFAYVFVFFTILGKTYVKIMFYEETALLVGLWQFISSYALYTMICYLLNAQMQHREFAEKALDDLSQLNQAIITEAESGVMVFNADGLCIIANQAAAEISGCTLEQIRLVNYRENNTWRNFGLLKAAEEALKTGITQKINAPVRTSYGKDFWCMASIGRITRIKGGHYLLIVFADISAYKEIERKVIDISEQTKRRVGQELHDDLGQHLTGLAFISEALTKRLKNQNHPDAHDSAKLTDMLNEAISKTRELAQGLYPVEIEEIGLRTMLQQLANNVESMYQTSCEFICEEEYKIEDPLAPINLFRISQEAVNNAVKHGKASRITLKLVSRPDFTALEITDNGCGIDHACKSNAQSGLGMHTMQYRASLLGASMRVLALPAGGTSVLVNLPVKQSISHAAG